ncbi:HlyD family type I secretion periplasmic adaptor subunit [Ruegeria sp.]|uniref:HlyD family type I secretion periplasmic adaptor subunit n=1 Tax=Ruegeria sp. TaxID=1879320 RepID=UPI003B00B2AC
MKATDRTLRTSIARHLWGAGLFLIGLLAFMVGWAAWMQISGAVIAPGAVVVESNVKTIKHKEGGIVAEILVKEGELVRAGERLLRLDDALTRATFATISKQLDDLLATQARLVAERDGTPDIVFPRELTERSAEAELASVLTGQRALKDARSSGLAGRMTQLNEQIRQLRSQIDGLEIQAKAKAEEITLVKQELTGLEKLMEQSLVPLHRVLAARRTKTRLVAERGVLLAEAARAGLAISERRVMALQVQENHRAQVLEALQQARREIAQLGEQKMALLDRLSRMEIRAPQTGYVHQLAVYTKGAFISPAEPIMQIVPNEDALVIETKVAPDDIDQVHIGQKAVVRLSGLNQRTTPELEANVFSAAAETTRDEITGAQVFAVRLRLAPGEEDKIGKGTLKPGMPVEGFITTANRTILSYLVQPVTDQITHALRED